MSAYAPITERYLQNMAHGDCATRARVTARTMCHLPHLPQPRPCVMKGYKDSCEVCKSHYELEFGVRSSHLGLETQAETI